MLPRYHATLHPMATAGWSVKPVGICDGHPAPATFPASCHVLPGYAGECAWNYSTTTFVHGGCVHVSINPTCFAIISFTIGGTQHAVLLLATPGCGASADNQQSALFLALDNQQSALFLARRPPTPSALVAQTFDGSVVPSHSPTSI